MYDMVYALVHCLDTTGASGATRLLAPITANCSGAGAPLHLGATGSTGGCITGSTSATDFCRTRPIHSFFKFFLRVLLCLAFLLHPWDVLMFT